MIAFDTFVFVAAVAGILGGVFFYGLRLAAGRINDLERRVRVLESITGWGPPSVPSGKAEGNYILDYQTEAK